MKVWLISLLLVASNFVSASPAWPSLFDKRTDDPTTFEDIAAKHLGKPYVYPCKNIDDWKNKLFPDAKIAIDLEWNVTHEYVDPDGYFRSGFLINGQAPGPAINAKENDWIRVVVYNYLPVAMTIHFHGIDQAYTPWSDGTPGITQYPILSGGSYTYIFQFKNQHGAFWYHAHYRAYFQDGVYGPINISPADEVKRPYDKIQGITDTAVQHFIGDCERKPTNLIVSDGYRFFSDEILVRYFQFGVLPLCTQSILINGKGRVTCEPQSAIDSAVSKRGPLPGPPPPPGTPPPKFDSMGCVAVGPPIPNAAALGAGGTVMCPGNTQTDREIIYTEDEEYLYFNLYNMATEMPKVFSIDEHDLIVVGVDGMYCEPKITQQIEIPVATRFTVIVKTKKDAPSGSIYGMRFATSENFQVIEGISYLVYGKTADVAKIQSLSDAPSQRTQDIGGTLLSKDAISIGLEDLTPLGDDYTPYKGDADHTVHLVMNLTNGGHFTLFQDQALLYSASELDEPFLLRTDPARLDFSKIPTAVNPGIKIGQTVDIVVNNPNFLTHPFHMHGHSFSVISTSHNTTFPYKDVKEALEKDPGSIDFDNAQFVDTVDVYPGGHVVLRFTAHNPGYWLFHCHINHHFLSGMAGFFVIDAEKIPPIPFPLYEQPHAVYDSAVQLWISEPRD